MVEGLFSPVRPPKATEDFVFGFCVPSLVQESTADTSMSLPKIDGMQDGIRACMDAVSESVNIQKQQQDGIILTIPKDDPHVMFLSTGRCGTMSLTNLLYDSNLTPYHEFWWTVEAPYRHEMQARIQSARFDNLYCANIWASTRAVEWLGASVSGKPLVDLNHMDTIFTPVFATLHPNARFVWLKRDPESLFKSFYSKHQWDHTQLKPIQFSFDPFRYADGGYDLIPALAWYIVFTETFARSFQTVIGDRLMEINSEDLFGCDPDVISRLLDFIGSDIPLDRALEHFIKPVNEKSHKVWCDDHHIEEALQFFRISLDRIRETGL